MRCLRDRKTVNFILGLTLGFVAAFVLSGLFATTERFGDSRSFNRFAAALQGRSYDNGNVSHDPRGDNGLAALPAHDHPMDMHDQMDSKSSDVNVNLEDDHLHNDDDSEAKRLFKKVRVLCWVMTAPKNLDKKAARVKMTWGKRCNIILFFSSVTNSSFPTIGLNISEGREHLTGKTVRAFNYIYKNYFDQADWFMKADDDTYVIMENLRYFLSGENTSAPIYFGHHFKTIVKQGYFSGGAGYVFSKEALKRFATTGRNPKTCRQDGGAEDAEIGHCMQRLGVKTGNSTDAMGRSRFHCFDPETHLFGGYPGWYYQYDANGAKMGEKSMSDYAISFHYVPPNKMMSLEFYIYHLRPYGIVSGLQPLNQHHNPPS